MQVRKPTLVAAAAEDVELVRDRSCAMKRASSGWRAVRREFFPGVCCWIKGPQVVQLAFAHDDISASTENEHLVARRALSVPNAWQWLVGRTLKRVP